MRTHWWCEGCHASGVIVTTADAGVYEVLALLTAGHSQNPLAIDQHCTHTGQIRVHLHEEKKT